MVPPNQGETGETTMKRIVLYTAAAMLVMACGEDSTKDDGGGEGQDAGAAFDANASGGPCSDCVKDSDCGPGLTCDKPAFVCKKPADVKAKNLVCDEDCADGIKCSSLGLCRLVGGECQAVTIADCLGALTCKEKGRCTAKDGKCVVAADTDCVNADVCKNENKCTLKDGECVETKGTKCGDGKCEAAETKDNCPADCGPVGGDPCPCDAGVCGVKPGCPNDCGGCTGDKSCFGNKCVDKQCKLPSKWPKAAQRVMNLTLLNHKTGCDLDDTGKANNILGKLLTVYAFINEHTSNAIESAKLNLMLMPDQYDGTGKAFGLSLIDAVADDAKCNPKQTTCGYTAAAHSYDVTAKVETCPALAHVTNAVVNAGKLTAGGKGNTTTIALYIVGVPLLAKLQNVVMSGDADGKSSEWHGTTKGRICGAIAMTDLNATAASLPESALLGTGFDKKKVEDLVASLFKPDIDLDGDGNLDAISAAWAFNSSPAKVSGVK